jgi:hypothetical protein
MPGFGHGRWPILKRNFSGVRLAGGIHQENKMTTSTREPLVCDCGHKGQLKFRENDAPFSSLWESYSLEGFDGGKLTITSYKDRPADMSAALKPTCPNCKQTGKVRYA